MTQLNLREQIHFCKVGEALVFMDLLQDRYFQLPDRASAAFSALLANMPTTEVAADLASLQRDGLLVEAPLGRPILPTLHAAPERSLVEEMETAPSASLPAALEIGVLLASARRSIRCGKLPRLIGEDRRVQTTRTSAPAGQDRDRLVAGFLSSRRLVPISPNCLADSLALWRYLARRNVLSTLVIGVKLHPFGAHCWLQDDSLVLNDTLSTARGFSPILTA